MSTAGNMAVAGHLKGLGRQGAFLPPCLPASLPPCSPQLKQHSNAFRVTTHHAAVVKLENVSGPLPAPVLAASIVSTPAAAFAPVFVIAAAAAYVCRQLSLEGLCHLRQQEGGRAEVVVLREQRPAGRQVGSRGRHREQ